jgi:hypothetical protein
VVGGYHFVNIVINFVMFGHAIMVERRAGSGSEPPGSSSVHGRLGRSFSRIGDGRPVATGLGGRTIESTSDRPIAAEARKEAHPMFAQSPVVENDPLGVIPALWLLLVLVLTAIGVVAHATFA